MKLFNYYIEVHCQIHTENMQKIHQMETSHPQIKFHETIFAAQNDGI